ncbi:MAG: hypothetical protein KDD03_11860 [Gelidibacter sp.]|nr:hypothetical protein [Gelidibacter sp.]
MAKKKKDSVSYLAMFIAVLALIVSIYEGYEIRKHNRLSLKPYLDGSIFMQEKKLFKIEIRNEGLGPAIVEEFSIYANGKKVSSWNNAMKEIGMKKFSQLTNMKPGDIISQGENLTLVKIDTVLLKYNLEYVIKYKSVYEESFKIEQEF